MDRKWDERQILGGIVDFFLLLPHSTTTITTTYNTQTLYNISRKERKKNYVIFSEQFFFLPFSLFFSLLPFVLDWIGVKYFFLFFFRERFLSSQGRNNVWIFFSRLPNHPTLLQIHANTFSSRISFFLMLAFCFCCCCCCSTPEKGHSMFCS